MDVYTFTVGPFSENTYLLVEEGEAILIDPGFYEDNEFENFKRRLEQQSAELVAVVLTHAHVDHILGLGTVADTFDVPVFLSDEDRYLWNNFPSQAQMFGFRAETIPVEPEPLRPLNPWEVGSFVFDVRYTPGHSPDHVVLYSEKDGFVIGGDTLFRQGIGRTDLYKGSFRELKRSIRGQLYTLPDDTVIYPGHGPETTIGHEKAANPFVKAAS